MHLHKGVRWVHALRHCVLREYNLSAHHEPLVYRQNGVHHTFSRKIKEYSYVLSSDT